MLSCIAKRGYVQPTIRQSNGWFVRPCVRSWVCKPFGCFGSAEMGENGHKWLSNSLQILVACTQLYKLLCRLVGLSVGLSVAEDSEHATYGDWPCSSSSLYSPISFNIFYYHLFFFFHNPLSHPYFSFQSETDALFRPTSGTSADVPDVPSNAPMLSASCDAK